MTLPIFERGLWSVVVAAVACSPLICSAADAESLKPVPAVQSPIATQSPVLSAAWAGKRVVTVGANGVVLLSDDAGRSYRQAKSVPVSSTLTSTSFPTSNLGWAVGHWGAILNTNDGGETWKVQRLDTSEDRPLFAVDFTDEQHGVAVGLWSLVLTTDDGGKTWQERQILTKAGKKSDANLLGIFSDRKGSIYATAEKGQVFRSTDHGHNWDAIETGYKGSLWTGAVLEDGAILVGGQRGTLMRSADGGRTWVTIPLGTKNSVTTISEQGKAVLVGGLDGLQMLSHDRGLSFSSAPKQSGESVTVALPRSESEWLLFSRRGVVQQ
ncbi:Uncharacterized protein SAMN04488595_12224 [Ralstonia sp. 25mfcol4.1]|uniref:WD40/YVTN/BNR-like repeat-containing protein n=1 Tax=Ralstonia sp. 25mfcol4.1 TaxID=1761899 RepID=UPI00040171EC|nr:YCF48-related protein [Ralstonia sp. 25mfcol4.1]SDP77608.1 Uncharacterized protein SAMN04488595_12224 [Ralstonia sp. 25mfcol4.1]